MEAVHYITISGQAEEMNWRPREMGHLLVPGHVIGADLRSFPFLPAHILPQSPWLLATLGLVSIPQIYQPPTASLRRYREPALLVVFTEDSVGPSMMK